MQAVLFWLRPEEYQLLVTFGLLLILEDVMRFFWGALPLSPSVPADYLGSTTLLEATYPNHNFLVIAVGALAAVAMWAFFYRTRFGVLLRATSQDMRMTSALGVNVRRVYLLAFSIGCFLAGLGGALVSPTVSITLGMDHTIIIEAFLIVTIGGLGNMWGAMAGSLIFGVSQSIGVLLWPQFAIVFQYLAVVINLTLPPVDQQAQFRGGFQIATAMVDRQELLPLKLQISP